MPEKPKKNCKVVRLVGVGALVECVDGRDAQAAEFVGLLNDAELEALEIAAAGLSLMVSEARGGRDAPSEGWRAAYNKLAAEAVVLRERAEEAELDAKRERAMHRMARQHAANTDASEAEARAETARAEARYQNANAAHLRKVATSVAAEQARNEAEAAIARVRRIHHRGQITDACNDCGQPWPCEVERALDDSKESR